MAYSGILEIGANIASIITALIAGAAYWFYQWDKYRKRARLEKHLRTTPEIRGPRPVVYLAVELGMTETEIMDAAFRSKHINRQVTPEMIGAPTRILLQYKD